MKTILVTGHTGFIGNHLVKSLKNKFHVVGLSSIYQKNLGITQIKKDIVKITEKDIPHKVSTIIHLAAISDVSFCQKYPSKTCLTNIQGTQNILEIARKKNSKLIFMSSSHVYGKPQKLPINENHLKHPQSIYSATKIAGETLCESYSNSYGLDISVIRLFSVFGPNAPKHSLINSIVSQLLNKQKIELGNLTSKRDFIFISDVISAIEKIEKNNHDYNEYNVGTGTKTSIIQICKLLNQISKKHLPIISISSKKRKNDVSAMFANVDKLKNTGWEPKISLYDGLKITYNSYLDGKKIGTI